MASGVSRIESLRRLISPDREVLEMTAALEPQTALDSMVRELFSRMVRDAAQKGAALVIDRTDPVNGNIHFEEVSVNGRQMVNVWWEP